METEWKKLHPFAERYDNIQLIQVSRNIALDQAMPIEREAWEQSTSKTLQEEYLSKCRSPSTATFTTTPPLLPRPELQEGTRVVDSNSAANNASSTDDGETVSEFASSTVEGGVTIASYSNCTLIAGGVTSDVYRWHNKALKVITVGNKPMEPHNPQREIKILESLRSQGHRNIIELFEAFRTDAYGYRESLLVLEFNYMPLTLADVLARKKRVHVGAMREIFRGTLHGLLHLHSQGIIHRDIKPSAILLKEDQGSPCISDFGTAWHPEYSSASEPPDNKILDVGTGAYRAPDCLFGNKSYTTAIDMWSFGIMVSETLMCPLEPIIQSPPAHEDGSQLGLILSIFKTLGTPTKETWPEAAGFKVSPFEMWTVFPQRPWTVIMPGADGQWRDLVAGCLKYGSERLTASQALASRCFV